MKKRKGNTKKRFYEVGEDGELTFKPSTRMQLFAAYWFCHPQYKSFSSDELCKELGYQKGTFEEWCHKYDPDFTEWIEEQRAMFRGRENAKKAMLEFVGMQKSMEGDFQFWKLLAQREKVITPDQMTHNFRLNLESMNDLSESQIQQHADSLLQSIISLENQGGIDMVEGISEQQPENSEGGAIDVPFEPLEISNKMGDN
jgi:hypothetical protein